MYVPLTLNLFFGKQITDLITLNVQSFNSVIVTEKKKKKEETRAHYKSGQKVTQFSNNCSTFFFLVRELS